jgi:hypothetical protein
MLSGVHDEDLEVTDPNYYLNSATVTYAIYLQGSGTPISGGTGTLDYVTASNGDYTGVVNSTVLTPTNVLEGYVYEIKGTLVQGNYNRVWKIYETALYGD